MSRPGITYQEVAHAALTLQAQNENPTVDRVRELLGTGSKSTIARNLKAWKSTVDHIVNVEHIPDEILALVKGLWARMKTEADLLITDYQEVADRMIAETEARLQQKQQQNTELQKQTAALAAQVQHQEAHTNTLQFELAQEKQITATLTERNDRLTQQLREEKFELEKLHQLLTQVQKNLAHNQQTLQQLQHEHALTLDKQNQTHKQDSQQYQQQLNILTTQKNNLQIAFEKRETEFKNLEENHDALSTKQIALSHELKTTALQIVSVQQQLALANQTNHDYQVQYKMQTEKLATLEKQAAIASHEVERLSQLLQETQMTLTQLQQEKLHLVQENSYLSGKLAKQETISE